MTPRDDDWDDFAVYPFRRQLVDDSTQMMFPPTELFVPPARVAPPPPDPLPEQRPRRARANPLRLAVPVALVAFIAALAGAATISSGNDVPDAIQPQITPAAEAAAEPKQRPHRTAAPTPVLVPDVVGLKRKQAVTRLKERKLKVRVRLVAGKPGLVLDQRPKAAAATRPGRLVVVVVGRPQPKHEPKPERVAIAVPQAPPTVIVAGVVGLEKGVATQALVNEGLGVRIYGVPSARPAGTVVAQSPRGGARAETGSYVRINVAVN